MENKKEKTAPNVSVGADTEQPLFKSTESSISECYGKGVSSNFEEMQREIPVEFRPILSQNSFHE